MEAREISDDDWKTRVFPIVCFSIDLCVRFSERMRSVMRSFGMIFFFFLWQRMDGIFFFFLKCGSGRIELLVRALRL